MEAGITDPDGGQAPAPLRDRTGLGGAGVAEAFPTRTAVVLVVVLLEHLPARVAFLHGRTHTRMYKLRTNTVHSKKQESGNVKKKI